MADAKEALRLSPEDPEAHALACLALLWGQVEPGEEAEVGSAAAPNVAVGSIRRALELAPEQPRLRLIQAYAEAKTSYDGGRHAAALLLAAKGLRLCASTRSKILVSAFHWYAGGSPSETGARQRVVQAEA